MSPMDKEVIIRVLRIRKEKKKRQKDLAAVLAVTPAYIGNIESQKYGSKYDLDDLNRLAALFEVSPKDFLPDEPIPTPPKTPKTTVEYKKV